MRSSVVSTQEVRLIGLYEPSSFAGLPALSRGMMVAVLHTWGMSAPFQEQLKIPSSSSRAKGPRAFRKVGGMSSGPAAPFFLIFLMADFSSVMVESWQLAASTEGAFILFLVSVIVARSSFVNSSLLTFA